MKLKVEIDIDPTEVDLATELINTLRILTEHVKVNVGGPNGVPASGAQTTKVLPPAPPAPDTSVPRQQDGFSVAAATASSSQAAQPVDTNGYLEPSSAGPSNIEAICQEWIAAIKQAHDAGNAAGKEEVIEQLRLLLPTELETDEDKSRFESFLKAFEEALWQKGGVHGSYVVPLCHILPRLPIAVKEEAKKLIISKVLKHLMIKRPVNRDRLEFFAQAEAFAAMIQLEFVLIPGAIQTIVKLLKREDTCAAAITMLGKTVELCNTQLLEACDEAKLNELRAALHEVQYTEFQYDKQYIMDCMHWSQPASGPPQIPSMHPLAATGAPEAQPSAGPVPCNARLLKLEPVGSWASYNAPVKGVVVDEANQQVVSISNNGLLVLHSFDGRELKRVDTKVFCYTDLDFNPDTGILALAGVPLGRQADPGEPIYATYLVEPGHLRPMGTVKASPTSTMLSQLRFLAQSDEFIVAETTTDRGHVINIIDSKMIQGTMDVPATPVKVMQTSHTLITALSPSPRSKRAFLSGDKSGNVFVWDIVKPDPVATLWPPHQAGDDLPPNTGVITCMEMLDHLVLAGAYDQGINVWDLRQLKDSKDLKPCCSIRLDAHVVTRMARGPKPFQLAVATVKSIHALELDLDGTVAGNIEGRKAGEKFYYDAKWSLTTVGPPMLYAASAGGSLDLYQAIQVQIE